MEDRLKSILPIFYNWVLWVSLMLSALAVRILRVLSNREIRYVLYMGAEMDYRNYTNLAIIYTLIYFWLNCCRNLSTNSLQICATSPVAN